jgi:hypothetical protein
LNDSSQSDIGLYRADTSRGTASRKKTSGTDTVQAERELPEEEEEEEELPEEEEGKRDDDDTGVVIFGRTLLLPLRCLNSLDMVRGER